MNKAFVKIFVHIFLVDVYANFFWVYSKKGVELLGYTIGLFLVSIAKWTLLVILFQFCTLSSY